MLVPLGYHQEEVFEKNEKERIEEFSHAQRLASKETTKSLGKSKERSYLSADILFNSSVFLISLQLVRKIYLLQRNLLI